MVKRQVRYSIHIDTGEQANLRHRWTIAIVNEPREIERIQQRFLLQLSHCDDLYENYECFIENSRGLHCRIFSFSSEKGRINDYRKIYDSENFRKDRDLRDRSEQDLENYVKRLIG